MSDQDFFFDDEATTAEKPAKTASKPASKSAAPAKGGKAAPAQASGGVELTWTITALIAVVTLLLGVIVGYAIPRGAEGDQGAAPLNQIQAPQLSPEEMQTGELPEGHPDIGAMTGGSTGTTGSAETTGN